MQKFSTAGFYQVPSSGREVYDFNVGWRFFKGDIKAAEQTAFNDKNWKLVNVPDGLELLPLNASGGKNYQGIAWYRKHFNIPSSLRQKRITLHFEAIMGKSKVYVNGKLVKEHFGGYLPVIVELNSTDLFLDKENVVAVMADNSDDPLYPPGKPQASLDFTYFGGIYRDVWMIGTNDIFITDANSADKTAGGGIFYHCENISEAKADVIVSANIANQSKNEKSLQVLFSLKDDKGKIISEEKQLVKISNGSSQSVTQKLPVDKPQLWVPETPNLYNLYVSVMDEKGNTVDGFYVKAGIRQIEFRGKDGFYLNGKYFNDKLVGTNRHQDFAYIGYAMPNSLHWRDAKKLKDAGIRVIRSHYPQDPAFMDACDQLGMFIIVSAAGWQFWNNDTTFINRCYSDTRNMVRRDRNHPAVIMWEPILNETHYPTFFAKKVYEIVHEEYPYQGCFVSCDINTNGYESFDVLYSHPDPKSYAKTDKSLFTREWGDNVDDWNTQNSSSRVNRNWGEIPQLIQAIHYANPAYPFTSFQTIYQAPPQLVGGCFWHSFDHQRGYHPDPFLGGFMDAFRQQKFSYEMFRSQRNPLVKSNLFNSGYTIYIANEMTPFSPQDVTVFANCDEVRLIVLEKDTLVQKNSRTNPGMPYPPFVFKNVYNYMQLKALHRAGKWKQASIVAEGLVDGKVVVTTKKMPAKRPDKIMLSIDHEGQQVLANGSDIIVVIASIADNEGNVRRLTNEEIKFEIEGEGQIVGDAANFANPREVQWGTAPVLIRTTTTAGKIKIKAHLAFEGAVSTKAAELEFESVKPTNQMVYKEVGKVTAASSQPALSESFDTKKLQQKIKALEAELNKYRLKQTEKDQEIFEHKKAGN